MDERLSDLLAPERFLASLIGGLGVVALLLSTLGIYGVVAYAVGRQTREIGVRMALGEEPHRVRRRVVLSAFWMAAAGAAAGVALALGASRWLAAFLVGVDPRDPRMLVAAAALLTVVALLAAYVPAHRASQIDPLVALRSD
jgi:ABC-type antimicrobial peptide transport system permease subunit